VFGAVGELKRLYPRIYPAFRHDPFRPPGSRATRRFESAELAQHVARLARWVQVRGRSLGPWEF
jgi:hypothetical protein